MSVMFGYLTEVHIIKCAISVGKDMNLLLQLSVWNLNDWNSTTGLYFRSMNN